MIAKTDAAGGPQLLPAVLEFTSSLSLDLQLVKEDLLGSLAHVVMLARQGILRAVDARAIHAALVEIGRSADAGTWTPSPEEDVHMAVEAELKHRLGAVAGLLHTARSRNDQVALDLRLRTRAQCSAALGSLGSLIEGLVTLAARQGELLMPAYTHRQRAQPITLAYWLCGYGAMFSRDVRAFEFALESSNSLPLGVGAIAGTSLPIDREVTRELLAFGAITGNGLDTVGDRDFALDLTYASAKCALHASRLATDIIDFATAEFGFVELSDGIACGSSMMPQKRNPDLFELIRGKSGPAVGSLMSLLVTVKGLPGGYNRDLQEDRRVVLEAGPRIQSVLDALRLGLENLRFNPERCQAGLEGGATQATDLAEALVVRGVPFREAYQAVGTLVARSQAERVPLDGITPELARTVHPGFTAEVLASLDGRTSVARKVNAGGTGPASVQQQLAVLRTQAQRARASAAAIPSVDSLLKKLAEVSL